MKCKVCFERDSRIDGMCNDCWYSFLSENKKTGIGKSKWIVENAKHNSTIFTNAELQEFQRRLEGKKEDYKIWYRVKPKLAELVELFKQKKQIEKLLKETGG